MDKEKAREIMNRTGVPKSELNQILKENFNADTEDMLWMSCGQIIIDHWADTLKTIDIHRLKHSIFNSTDESEEHTISLKTASFLTEEKINSVRKALQKHKIKVNKTIYIHSEENLHEILKSLNIYETYQTYLAEIRTDLAKIEKANISVKFQSYNSWENGLNFLILHERVSDDVFRNLIAAGMYQHEYNAEMEERFTGWCLFDSLNTRIELAKQGIKVL